MRTTEFRPYVLSPSAGWVVDLVRGLAALAVFAGHARNLFFADWADVADRSPVARAVYFLTGFGHEAVILFFVLSGFLIGASVLRDHHAGTRSWKKYFLQRFTRLYVVLIPALLVGLAWDLAGMRLFGTAGVYGANPAFGNVVSTPVAQTTTGWTYLGNLAFLQRFFVDTAGSNGPLWSLAYEFWCYAMFPLLFSPGGIIAFVAAGSALLFGLNAGSFVTFLAVWLAGVGVAAYALRSPAPARFRWAQMTLGTLALFGALGIARVLGSSLAHKELLVGGAAATFLLALCRSQSAIGPFRRRWERPVRGLAGFSYTLYLTHLPPLAFFSACWLTSQKLQPSGSNLILGAGLLGGILVYSYGLSRLTEAHTATIRRGIMALPIFGEIGHDGPHSGGNKVVRSDEGAVFNSRRAKTRR